jgi:hypothetical protein
VHGHACYPSIVVRGLVVVLVAMSAVMPTAHADPGAEQLFRDGRDLLERGKVADACDRFARSQELEARYGTLLNLGDCLEQLGRTASAWEAFMAAKAFAATSGDPKKLKAAKIKEAKTRAARLEPALAYLTIVVPAEVEVQGLALVRNGVAIGKAAWNVAVPVDPGDQAIVASAPGYESWADTRAVGARERATISIPPLTALPPPATDPPEGEPAGDEAPETPETRTRTAAAAPVSDEPRDVVPPAPARVAELGRWAIGATFGESTGLDATFGVRVFRNVPTGSGAVRAMVSALYDNFNDDNTNGFSRSHQILVGGAAEYVWVQPRVAFALGVTAGIDVLFRNMDRGAHAAPWWGIRASPVIVRFPDADLELGVHLLGIQSTDRFAAFGLVGLDWYLR